MDAVSTEPNPRRDLSTPSPPPTFCGNFLDRFSDRHLSSYDNRMKPKLISNENRWERGFAALSKFRKRSGHCCPPQTHVEGKFRLGQWVSVQRYLKGKLSIQRKRRLDRIGFVWNWNEYRWDNGFNNLLKFRKREGHCRVPIFHCEGKYKLGLWVSTQRNRKKKLSTKQRAQLNKIGFVWKEKSGPKLQTPR